MKRIVLSALFILVSYTNLVASESWFVNPIDSKKKILSNSVILIDARDPKFYLEGHIETARSLTWEELSEPSVPLKGNLLPSEQLVQKFQELGISNDSEVLVYGDPLNGWGEEGRIAWTLRSLGHKKSFIVDGGFPALVKLGHKPTKEIPAPAKKGLFINIPKKLYTVSADDVRNSLSNQNFVFIDSREPREFIGGNPYGESRGGHLPGAKHLFYKDFLDKNGEVLSSKEIKKKLASKGINDKSILVSYCTGGIRSGWLTAVLVSNGYDAHNYPGSMWEWSSLPSDTYPLVKGLD
ncbi:sulfurtransferase [Leptospira sp. GIMC2001]|uniref:sulfurtransferase n=1 Tax=Leptospira sp. GIMC2001 TaxID=1513297 RepID=UPI00234B4B36|nr:rhodanese-like domain-containing protein [Leptospira sp. GIMC2001]WCL50286.1 rhodanese-like domain-containing protein [Leptospira sp. GIMC2001]